MIRTMPLDWSRGPDGVVPRDPELWKAAQAWATENMGGEIEVWHYVHTWVAIEILDVTANVYRVVGITSAWSIPDCPNFHVAAGDGYENLQVAKAARDALMQRLIFYCQDSGFSGRTGLVYVAEEAERFWRGFLKLIGAKKANRWELKI